MAKSIKKKYDEVDKYKYHEKRDRACGRFGLNFGDAKHSYSSGFTDGVHCINNISAVRREFGAKSANSYALGNRRGRAASLSYFKRTGKMLSHESFK
jgi:hypothetical protein